MKKQLAATSRKAAQFPHLEHQIRLHQSHSAYNLRSTFSDVQENHPRWAVLVDNEAGGARARHRPVSPGQGYNIESLTVAEVDKDGHRSRITVVTHRHTAMIEQIQVSQAGPHGPVY